MLWRTNNVGSYFRCRSFFSNVLQFHCCFCIMVCASNTDDSNTYFNTFLLPDKIRNNSIRSGSDNEMSKTKNNMKWADRRNICFPYLLLSCSLPFRHPRIYLFLLRLLYTPNHYLDCLKELIQIVVEPKTWNVLPMKNAIKRRIRAIEEKMQELALLRICVRVFVTANWLIYILYMCIPMYNKVKYSLYSNINESRRACASRNWDASVI